jgi:hypothetical protein
MFCIHNWIVLIFTTSKTQILRTLIKLLTHYYLYLLLKQCARTGKILFICYQSWNGTPNVKWENSTQFKYILSTGCSQNIICCTLLLGISRFSYPTGVRVCMLLSYPHSSNIPGTSCRVRFHSIWNLEFYLNLISNNIMMECGGRGDLHPRTFNCFTSVTCVLNLALLSLYPGKEPTVPIKYEVTWFQEPVWTLRIKGWFLFPSRAEQFFLCRPSPILSLH